MVAHEARLVGALARAPQDHVQSAATVAPVTRTPRGAVCDTIVTRLSRLALASRSRVAVSLGAETRGPRLKG